MYELIPLTENDYYVNCPAKIGIVCIGSGEVVLIDSGSDKDAGKKVLRILQSNGWQLKAIFNTHSHADHIGGNRFLQEKTGCRIFAPGMECAYTNQPLLEPVGLYGGQPLKELKHKFLMAQASEALPLTEAVLPAGMTVLPLPGHSFDMVGFLTPDGTAFIADSVASEETLNKYGISYLWDAEQSLQTLEALLQLRAQRFVPSHAEVTEDIAPLVQVNIRSICQVQQKLLELCAEPITFEALLKRVFDEYGMTMTVQQYALIGSTVRSCLTGLSGQGKVSFSIENNEMRWKTV